MKIQCFADLAKSNVDFLKAPYLIDSDTLYFLPLQIIKVEVFIDRKTPHPLSPNKLSSYLNKMRMRVLQD